MDYTRMFRSEKTLLGSNPSDPHRSPQAQNRRFAIFAGSIIVSGTFWSILLYQFSYDVPLFAIVTGIPLSVGIMMRNSNATQRLGVSGIVGWGVGAFVVSRAILIARLMPNFDLPFMSSWPQTLSIFSVSDLFSLLYLILAAYWMAYMLRRGKDKEIPEEVASGTSQNDILIAQITLLIMVGIFATVTNSFPSIDILTIGMVGMLLWYPRHRAYLRDLLPVLMTLLAYESLRVFADDLSLSAVHVTDLIHFEMALFGGHLPNVWVQNLLWDRAFSPALTVLFTGFYYSHFIVPLIILTVLWQKRRDLYWPFVSGFIILAWAAFATYVLFPAAPPWWATYFGYLQGEFAVRSYPPAALMLQSPNPVAAMPSLHMASPVYIALFASTIIWKKRGWLLWIIPLGVGFATLYLGHHYVIDLMAGSLYATIVYAGVRIWLRRRNTAPTGSADSFST